MKARSIKGNSTAEIEKALRECMDQQFSPTLGIIFISIRQDRESICDLLTKAGIDVLGATSAGEFIDGHQGQGSIVILLMDLNRDAYSIWFEDTHDRDLGDASRELSGKALKKFKKPAFIVCSSGFSTEGEIFGGNVLLRSLADALGPDMKVFGGMAGDDATFTGSYVFTKDKSTDNGFVALVLDEDRVHVLGMAISGWKSLGTLRTVTKSSDGWVYSIDDQPALDMYLKYLGHQPKNEEEKVKIFHDVGLFYPLQVENTDDPVMRTPVMVKQEEKAIKFDFHLPENTRFRFSMPPDFDIVENIIDQAKELKKSGPGEAEALLIFSCHGRAIALGPMTTMENDGLADIFKAPMAGFFTYGEYGTTGGEQHFYSTTISWVALTEK